MSTNFYLVCTSHEPYISSGEVGHNALCLPDVRHAIANKDGIVELYKDALKRDVDITEWDVEVCERNMFFVVYLNCEIAIKDEYGRGYAIKAEDGDTEPINGHPCNHNCEPTFQNTRPESSHYLDCPVWERVRAKG
jgi:hypothetical protein